MFDFGRPWGKTFELSFVRQYATADGDLQQIHLVAHFPPTALDDVVSEIDAGQSSVVWSFDTGGSGRVGRTKSWIAFVEASPVFRRMNANAAQPLGDEVWQESAE